MANPSISIDDRLLDDVDSRVRGTDSRSEWLSGAARLRLALEDAGVYEEFVAEYVDENGEPAKAQ